MNDDSKKSSGKALRDLIEMIPIIGKPLGWILEHLGVKGLVGALFGASLVTLLVYFDHWPKFLVSEKYKTIEQAPKIISRIKPDQLRVAFKMIPYLGQEEWFTPYIHLLEAEGDTEKKLGKITQYKIAVLNSQALPATAEFDWNLKASPEFLISGWAFKITSRGHSKLIQPLKARKDSTEIDTIRFTATPCEEGDILIGIVRVSGIVRPVPKDLLAIINQTVD